jgi:hypothetical protein
MTASGRMDRWMETGKSDCRRCSPLSQHGGGVGSSGGRGGQRDVALLLPGQCNLRGRGDGLRVIHVLLATDVVLAGDLLELVLWGESGRRVGR